VKRYEGLFILHNPTKEDGIKEVIDAIVNDMTTLGVQVENIQKMDRKAFARVADKKVSSGYYVNIIFQAKSSQAAELIDRMNHHDQVFRLICAETSRAAAEPAVA